MKKITKNNIAIVLQVFAVLVLFGYPGCAAENKKNNTVNSALNANKIHEKSEKIK